MKENLLKKLEDKIKSIDTIKFKIDNGLTTGLTDKDYCIYSNLDLFVECYKFIKEK